MYLHMLLCIRQKRQVEFKRVDASKKDEKSYKKSKNFFQQARHKHWGKGGKYVGTHVNSLF